MEAANNSSCPSRLSVLANGGRMSNFIYVETSVPSSFHETRQTEREQTRRRWTREWWDLVPHDLLVTSEAVLDELRRAPEPKRTRCLELLNPLRNVAPSTRTDTLVDAYMTHRLMPRDAKGDALHLALATYYRCAFLVTWNCRHLANPNKQSHIERVNLGMGFATPALVTPLHLLEL